MATQTAKYPGYRTMTGAQRRNAKHARIWDEARYRPNFLKDAVTLQWEPANVGCYWSATGKGGTYCVSTVHSDGRSWYSLTVNRKRFADEYGTLDIAQAAAQTLEDRA